ncbi:hydroxyacid dehydrogenase [Streptomyces sp. DT224]|uniref:hydroxyacid dehydrogenase n=1 Tax=Streptomyces sp. DT224 TaxID=3393426 RepID=UPI003CF8399A
MTTLPVHPRPAALLAMDPALTADVLPLDLLERLGAVTELAPGPAVTDFAEAPEALARTELLITCWGCPPIDASVLAAAPRLKAVVHAAGSVKDAVASSRIWERGIVVSSAAAANARPVAQFTLATVLLAGKRAFPLAAAYPQHGFRAYPTSADTGNHGRTVGVVGASRIGRLVLDMLRPHGFRLLVTDPYLDPAQARELGAELMPLDELMATADTVTLHAPLLPGTRRMINARRLGLMKNGAVLINTARGALVDTDALVAACADGRIDAVLDVVEPEPLPGDHPLFALPNVFVTPHIAGALGSELRLLGEFAVREAERWAAGEPLAGQVHADDLERIA